MDLRSAEMYELGCSNHVVGSAPTVRMLAPGARLVSRQKLDVFSVNLTFSAFALHRRRHRVV